MLWFIVLFSIFYIPSNINTISVKIDGLIDLGPRWNFEYNLVPVGRSRAELDDGFVNRSILNKDTVNGNKETVFGNRQTQMVPIYETPKTKLRKKRKKHENRAKNIIQDNKIEIATAPETKPESINTTNATEVNIIKTTRKVKLRDGKKYLRINEFTDSNNILLPIPHKVKDDTNVNDFTVHIYRQTLKLFESLKEKVNSTDMEDKVDFLERSYKKKFIDFVNETQQQNIRTRLGTQKAILNTMDMSNRLLKSLINYLLVNVEDNNLRSERNGLADTLEKQLEREVSVEYQHICRKFKICRSSYTFSNFFADFISEILRNEDVKLKQAVDAITEVLKYENFKNIFDTDLNTRFKRGIEYVETWGPHYTRAMLLVYRNLIAAKNKPISVMPGMDAKLLNKTIALQDLMNTFDEKIPTNEENRLAWNDIKNSLKDWTDGKRKDLMEIMDAFVSQITKKGLDNFDFQTSQKVSGNMRIVLE